MLDTHGSKSVAGPDTGEAGSFVRITLQFVLNGRESPSAVTGVEGPVTDLIVPAPGDYVEHKDFDGNSILAKVTQRSYRYLLSEGETADGEVAVIIWLDEVQFPKLKDGTH